MADPKAAPPKLLMGWEFIQALLDSGVITKEDNVVRAVIDVRADGIVMLHLERAGDERLLEVAHKTTLGITTKERQ